MLHLTRSTRLTLFLAGLVIICLALLALAYAYWPGQALREVAPLSPTLLAPP
jgi:hypothetical protein